MKKKLEDRPIYVPQARRIYSLEKKVEENSPVVELLGRYGRINHYEFEFTNDHDASMAAQSYAKCGYLGAQGGSLVGHVEAPYDPSMSRKIIMSRTMQADLVEKEDPPVFRQLLDEFEMGGLGSYKDNLWNKNKSGTNSWKNSGKKQNNLTCNAQTPLKHSIKYNTGGNTPFKNNKNSKNSSVTVVESNARSKPVNRQVSKHQTLPKASLTKVEQSRFTGNVKDSKKEDNKKNCYVEKKTNSTIQTSLVSFKSFQYEIRRQFPSCICRRLLIGMWMNFCQSDVYLNTETVAKTEMQCRTKQNKSCSLMSISKNEPLTMESSILYFQNLFDEFLKLTTEKPSFEAYHFLAYLCTIIADMLRYRDIHEMEVLKNSFKNNTLSKEDYESRVTKLYREGEMWYTRAAAYFPWESRIYTQLAELYSQKNNIQSHVSAIFCSIICPFRSQNEDVLTVLLETGSSSSVVNFSSRLFTLVQSLYCKIGLDQFDRLLNSCCVLLKDDISASITSQLFQSIVTAFQIMIFLMVETSNLLFNDVDIAKRIEEVVRSIPLHLVSHEDGSLHYQIDESVSDYTLTLSNLSKLYKDMTLVYAHVFTSGQELFIKTIESSERFALTCIAFCRLAQVVIAAIQSPLSPLLGVLNFIFYWLHQCGFLFVKKKENYETNSTRNDLLEDFLLDIAELKENFCDVLLNLGKTVIGLSQLKGELLQYSVPEDQYLLGCVSFPIEFCVDPKCFDDSTIISCSFVMSSKMSELPQLPYVCCNKSGHYPEFCHLNSLLEECVKKDELFVCQTKKPTDFWESKNLNNVLNNADVSINESSSVDNLSLDLLESDDHHDSGMSSDGLSHSTHDNSDTDSIDNADISIHGDCKEQCVSYDVSNSSLEIPQERMNYSNGNQPKSTTLNVSENCVHHHIQATKTSSSQLSLIRLLRLLIIAASLPEFRQKCVLNSVTVDSDSQKEHMSTNFKQEVSLLQQAESNKLLDDTKKMDGTDVACSQERRGLLKINPALCNRDMRTYKHASSRSSYKKGSKLHLTTKREAEAEAKLFDTGVKVEYRPIRGGKPRLPMDTSATTRPAAAVVEVVQADIPATVESKTKRILIVIDGSNVAHRHGSAMSKKFSSSGIQIVLDYYLKKNFNAIAFIPEYLTKYKDVADARRVQKAKLNVNVSKIADNIELLQDLSNQGLLITTPPQDYDDSYIIQYAMNHGGYIVSNDRFRDHKLRESRVIRRWLRQHVISFTFISDEFMPNPDFVFQTDKETENWYNKTKKL